MQESIVFLLRVQCRRKESSRSLSHLLMSFLYVPWLHFGRLRITKDICAFCGYDSSIRREVSSSSSSRECRLSIWVECAKALSFIIEYPTVSNLATCNASTVIVTRSSGNALPLLTLQSNSDETTWAVEGLATSIFMSLRVDNLVYVYRGLLIYYHPGIQKISEQRLWY